MPWLPSSALLPLLQEQSQKLNSRVTQLAGVVSSNKADQAHLNAQVNAELKRIGKVGDDRYKEHLKKDAELKSLMAANKADTSAQMSKMRETFYSKLTAIKDQMKKDRASHEIPREGSVWGHHQALRHPEDQQGGTGQDQRQSLRCHQGRRYEGR
jgi:hypothetical protein